MDDSPPPAYTASHNPKRTESRNTSKRADGRDTFPRPLPRLPGGETSSFKTGTVSPLRLHKKSQSTAIPSIERPWKPPSLDGGPPNSSWDSAVPNPPQFRHREVEFAQSPSSYQKFTRSPPPTPNAFEYGRSVGHFPTPAPNRGHERPLLSTQLPRAPAVDPNAFYNPAVSGHLSRPSISHPQVNSAGLGIRPNRPSSNSNNNPSRTGHVRWS